MLKRMKCQHHITWSLTVVLLAGFCAAIPGCDRQPTTVVKSDYPAADYDPLLTAYAKTAVPIAEALRQDEKVGGQLPSDYKTYNWAYKREAVGFSLTRHLGDRPTLTYDSARDKWEFDRGDGSYPLTLLLKVEMPGPL
jgi:hypothetical protein